ncbi:MAG: hypothetical protein GY803_20995 [Chloroflexi bacterium]|nr:hypothetical protein [Chloroflexota bacterium]
MSTLNAGNYIAYLIRLWPEGPGVWRGMLEDPNTGERYYFADIDELLSFLREQAKRKMERAGAGNQ